MPGKSLHFIAETLRNAVFNIEGHDKSFSPLLRRADQCATRNTAVVVPLSFESKNQDKAVTLTNTASLLNLVAYSNSALDYGVLGLTAEMPRCER